MLLSINHLPLRVNFSSRTIQIGNKALKFQPMFLTFYAIFVSQKTHFCRRPEKHACLDCTACFVSMSELKGEKTLKKIMKFTEAIYGVGASRLYDQRWQRYLEQGGMPEGIIRQYISKINRQIKKALNENADLYIINSCGHYASTKYGLRIDKSRIKFLR